MRIGSVNRAHVSEYGRLFRQLLPKATRNPPESVERAFQSSELRNSDGQLASEHIHDQIVAYYRLYRDDRSKYLAPYTSIVGPSGIGKSFAISQLAHGHGLYVVYSSLAETGELPYPRRSIIADVLPRDATRWIQVAFWESYILVSLYEAEVFKQLGVSAGGFYDIQTMGYYYRTYQEHFTERVVAFSKIVAQETEQMTLSEELNKLAQHWDLASELQVFRDSLNADGNNPKTADNNITNDAPSVLICLDEARSLLDAGESLLFRSFRDAVGRIFTGTSPYNFFAVRLDTASKVANFSPPKAIDNSQKFRRSGELPAPLSSSPMTMDREQKLFPPLYAIDTINVFASKNKLHPNGSEEATKSLFHYGRPLWGALFDSGDKLEKVVDLVREKVEGPEHLRLLALLSYRLTFYLSNNVLAEELVSGYLRYILHISEGREMLVTYQPSEPILTYVSSRYMLDPETRRKVFRKFCSVCYEGSVNVGDLGEIVAAMILFLTYDECVYVGPNATTYPRAISLRDYFTGLLGSEVEGNIMHCSSADPTMGHMYSEGTIFCNHFVKIHKEPTQKTLKGASQRGAGIFLPDNTPGVDILIPVKLPAGDMSCLAIQVKNRAHDTYSGNLKRETKDSLGTAKKWIPDMPYIGLTMALRCHNEEAGVGIVHPLKSAGRGSRQREAKTGYFWGKENDRILLLAVGLERRFYPNVFGGVSGEDILGLLRELLDCRPGVIFPTNQEYVNHVRSLEDA